MTYSEKVLVVHEIRVGGHDFIKQDRDHSKRMPQELRQLLDRVTVLAVECCQQNEKEREGERERERVLS